MSFPSKCYIVGESCLFDQVLKLTIEKEFELDCSLVECPELITGELSSPGRDTVLVFVDHADEVLRESLLDLVARYRSNVEEPHHRAIVAFYNAVPEHIDMPSAIRRGVRGIFLTTDSITRVTSGIRTLMEGEDWIPHDVLLAATAPRATDEHRFVSESHLTMREIEILCLLSTGATNDGIAEALFISPHTVKTHLYNVYQKLGVENRFHAAMWAERHLAGYFTQLQQKHRTAASAS